MPDVLDRVRRDTEALLDGGCDGLVVENMGDIPYLPREVAPETLAAFTLAADLVVQMGAPTGLQVLAGANRQALALASVVGADFIRAEGFAYAHVADEGVLSGCAGELLRARRDLGAESVAVWADVQKKHAAHAITGDLSLLELAKGTVFSGADVVIVTGSATGQPTSPDDVEAAKGTGVPVAVGSGVTADNLEQVAKHADALIVGSWLKTNGDWREAVDVERVRRLRAAMDQLV